MDNLIEKIMNNEDIEDIIKYVKNRIYINGPIDTTDMEILSYLKMYHPKKFAKYEGDILERMGLFYKKNKINSLEGLIMSNYKECIYEQYNKYYTPMQTDLINSIILNKNFSFSAPTSTGKSFIFRDLLNDDNRKNIVIIVPSRALINEYYIKINDYIKNNDVNILTSVELVNKKKAKRNIFILTPERAKELFKYKKELSLDMVLFDEAQLSDENSARGMIFDSVVRRIKKHFANAQLLFAHPFVDNPEAQLIKNDIKDGESRKYLAKNVGQMFVSYKEEKFFHFGIDKTIMGNTKQKMDTDPIADIIKNGGSVLIYTSKAKIYDSIILEEFKKYIKLCPEIKDRKALKLIKELKDLIGAAQKEGSEKHSNMISLLQKGIITHHGSLPLKARIILEEFTKLNFCKICFSTSTLVQGINMPFDLVYIEKFDKKKEIDVLNLIGRAGRATEKNKFDYGIIVVNDIYKCTLRNIINKKIILNTKSLLDETIAEDDIYVDEFKEAIRKETLDDMYNLAPKQLDRLQNEDLDVYIQCVLNYLIKDDCFISVNDYKKYSANDTNKIKEAFQIIFLRYLKREQLSSGEKTVLSTALRILLWQINGKTFKQVVWYRYAYISRHEERRNDDTQKNLKAKFTMKCDEIPNKNLISVPLFDTNKYANEIDYDQVVFDTYDYIDKIIGFKLKDVYYATFQKYFEKTQDERAKKMALYFKYGTIDDIEIMLIRYGFSFETIEWLKKHIKEINEDEIIFYDSIKRISKTKMREIERYL